MVMNSAPAQSSPFFFSAIVTVHSKFSLAINQNPLHIFRYQKSAIHRKALHDRDTPSCSLGCLDWDSCLAKIFNISVNRSHSLLRKVYLQTIISKIISQRLLARLFLHSLYYQFLSQDLYKTTHPGYSRIKFFLLHLS